MTNIKQNIIVVIVMQLNPCKYFFQISSHQNILIDLDLLPKKHNEYFFVACFDDCMARI